VVQDWVGLGWVWEEERNGGRYKLEIENEALETIMRFMPDRHPLPLTGELTA
jgi:hypothetical protein